jgi:hypothetical protein
MTSRKPMRWAASPFLACDLDNPNADAYLINRCKSAACLRQDGLSFQQLRNETNERKLQRTTTF